MADRHWHWSFRADDYHAYFTYETREDATDALEETAPFALEKEVFELPCDCGKPTVIKGVRL